MKPTRKNCRTRCIAPNLRSAYKRDWEFDLGGTRGRGYMPERHLTDGTEGTNGTRYLYEIRDTTKVRFVGEPSASQARMQRKLKRQACVCKGPTVLTVNTYDLRCLEVAQGIARRIERPMRAVTGAGALDVTHCRGREVCSTVGKSSRSTVPAAFKKSSDTLL